MTKAIVTIFLISSFLPVFSSHSIESFTVRKVFPTTKNHELIFQRPIGILTHNDKSYVLDNKECAINVISSDGELISKISKKGQGPGELLRPSSMCIQNNKLFILDTGKKQIFVFSLDGTLEQNIPLKFKSDIIVFNLHKLSNSNRVLLTCFPMDETIKNPNCLGLYNLDQQQLTNTSIQARQYNNFSLNLTLNKYQFINTNNRTTLLVNKSTNIIRKLKIKNNKISTSNLYLPKEIIKKQIPESELNFLSKITKASQKSLKQMGQFYSAIHIDDSFVFLINTQWDRTIKDFTPSKTMSILNSDFKFITTIDLPDEIKYFVCSGNKMYVVTVDFEFKIYQLTHP